MATIHQPVDLQSASPARKIANYPADSLRFDWLSIVLSAWFVGGLFLDGWAHNHIPTLESFFTPWHAVLYSGFFSVAVLMAVTQYRNVGKGYAWGRALPRGYWLSLVGVAIFFVGAGGDMLWHTIFGIEKNVEALFSPTHLLLASGAVLFLAGPLRAAWKRPNTQGWRELGPALFSLLMLFSLFTFFMQYANLFGSPGVLVGTPPDGGSYYINVTAVAYELIPAALTMGILLFFLRRWKLPFGAVTLILTVNTLLMLLMRFKFSSQFWLVVPAAFVTGLIADGLVWRLHPSMQNVGALRIFAFVVPFALFLLAFIALVLTDSRGLWWEIHMWLGVPFVAGAIGLGLSFLVAPPPIPGETTA
ncbi:MAG: hypothetical protein ABI690_00575 [Chloroflexota bacterium]